MSMRSALLTALAVLAFLGVPGCRAAGRAVEEAPVAIEAAETKDSAASVTAAPTFKVETWKNEKHEAASLAYSEGELLLDGKTALPRDHVRQINVLKPPTGDASTGSGEVCMTLEQLADYRRRAMAAARKYPGISAVLCLDHGVDGLRKEGGQYYRYHGLILVLKESKLSVANLSLWHEEGRTRSRILLGRSIQPDGTQRRLTPDMIRVTSRAEGAVHFSKRSSLVSATIPGVQIGSLVEFVYEIDLFNPDDPDLFFPGFTFQGEEPFLDSILEVKVPAGRKLNYAVRNMSAEAARPNVTTHQGTTTYRWEMHDVPPYVPEASMPEINDVLPNLKCSLFFDWEPLMEKVARFQQERIAATPEIEELVGKLTKGRQTDDEKLKALYEWVQRNINYLSIKGSRSSGWSGHPASETLKNGYGDCTDKAILFATFCKVVGIEAYPLIVKTNTEAAAYTEIPCLDANHCINVVNTQGRQLVLDATSSDYRYPYFSAGDHGIKGINCIKRQIIDIHVPPPADNLKTSEQTLVVAADGSGTMTEDNSYNGNYEAGLRYHWKRIPERERTLYMQQFLQRRVPGGQLLKCEFADAVDLSKPFTISMTYRIPHVATPAKDLLLLEIPTIQRDFPEAALPERKFPVRRYTSAGYRTSLVVKVPEGYEIVGVPQQISVDSDHLHYLGRYEVDASTKEIKLVEEFDVKTRWIPLRDYAAYRRDTLAVSLWTKKQIVLQRSREPAAAARPNR